MGRKRTKSIADREHKNYATDTETLLENIDPAEFDKAPELRGLSGRIEDYGYGIQDDGKRIRAEELERRALLNSMFMALIEHYPSQTKKSASARLNDVHSALFGKKPMRGRPIGVDQGKLDEIARRYFKAWMLGGSDTSLDKILIDELCPEVWDGPNPNERAEDRIKHYRKAFREQEEWLLARNTLMLDVTEDFKDRVEAATELLLELSMSLSN